LSGLPPRRLVRLPSCPAVELLGWPICNSRGGLPVGRRSRRPCPTPCASSARPLTSPAKLAPLFLPRPALLPMLVAFIGILMSLAAARLDIVILRLLAGLGGGAINSWRESLMLLLLLLLRLLLPRLLLWRGGLRVRPHGEAGSAAREGISLDHGARLSALHGDGARLSTRRPLAAPG
jgi:hypothetical protein